MQGDKNNKNNRQSSKTSTSRNRPQSAVEKMIVLSDDDSLIQELEATPRIARPKAMVGTPQPPPSSHNNQNNHTNNGLTVEIDTTPNIQSSYQRSPLLSPNEELTLLAVKHKPNSPDRDADQALEPPRSSHSRRRSTFQPPPSQQEQEQQTQHQHQQPPPFRGAAKNDDENQDTSNRRTQPQGTINTTTYIDPKTGQALHMERPSRWTTPRPSNARNVATVAASRDDPNVKRRPRGTLAKGGGGGGMPQRPSPTVPRAFPFAALSSSSSSSALSPGMLDGPRKRRQTRAGRQSTKYATRGSGSQDSGHTATPSTLVKRLQEGGDELRPYTMSYLPKTARKQSLLELAPSHDTDEEGEEPSDVESNSYLTDLGLAALDTTSSDHDGNDDGSSSSSVPALSGGNTNGDDNDDDYDEEHYPVGHSGSSSFATGRQVGYLIDSAEVYDEGAQREKIRREAQQRAEGRTKAAAVTAANAKVIPVGGDEYGDDDPWFVWKVYSVVGCMLLAVVAAVSVFFVVKKGRISSKVASLNDRCSTAYPLVNTTGGTVQGNILLDSPGHLDTQCQVESGNGYTLWYFIEGNNERLSASTCKGTATTKNSDTQVLVFAGPCGKLQCIAGSDQLCGSQASVGWLAEKGTRYYIVVKGFRTSNQGKFTLTLDKLEKTNNHCAGARDINILDIETIGSTRNLTVNNSTPTCDDIQVDAAASWFRLQGDGSITCASVATEESQKPNFPVALSVLQGLDCMGLSCKGVAHPRLNQPWITGDIAFVAAEGTSYYVVVQGDRNGVQGDFVLNLMETPPNGICQKAEPLLLGSGPMNGTMFNACNVPRSECLGLLNQPGVWYTVEGTGELLIVRVTGLTCQNEFGIQSQVSIFTSMGAGGCANLQCVESTSLQCTASNEKVVTQWFSNPNELYYVLVQSSDNTDFEIKLEEFIPGGSDVCVNASIVEPHGAASVGSTIGANPSDLAGCSNTGGGGIWYFVQGTGDSLEASTCNPGTNYSTALTILSGSCGSLQCVNTTTVSCDGKRSIAYWDSIPGVQYTVFVHGQSQSDFGRFSLTIEEGDLAVVNDFCGTAEPLAVPSETFGSTANATADDEYANMCGSVAAAPGVWYTVVGAGRFIMASLCGSSTNYDTQIYVFAGNSCTNLTCVNFNEDGCGTKSQISWNAQQGQLYYILVSGFNNAVGYFGLVIS